MEPLILASVIDAEEPSALVVPVRAMEQLTGTPNEAGVLTTIVPGAVKAVPAGELVAAPAASVRERVGGLSVIDRSSKSRSGSGALSGRPVAPELR
ncbi:hypothetical protein QM797_06275 [Rhodococcus sp. IEGM 1381]|uniref:hypothetical protein n=1 Tax=Rhodococcus sp. IEGM 1381 TaxID=3047085 RepID=UPI0024B6B224|nr:hypothetical protein [Rhodococcus sp. IEGM 1381]MDI9894329.1 hypothetical protein [Rhodococcus sp. IEGM 1381]